MKAFAVFLNAMLVIAIMQSYENDCRWRGFALWDHWAKCVIEFSIEPPDGARGFLARLH